MAPGIFVQGKPVRRLEPREFEARIITKKGERTGRWKGAAGGAGVAQLERRFK